MHQRLRDRGFVPPAPRALPPGSPAEVRTRLRRLAPQERAAIAASLVSLPDAASDRGEAERVLELLLTVPAEAPRADALIAALAPQAPRDSAMLWRFRAAALRLAPADRAAPASWAPLLAEVRAAEPAAVGVAAEAWALAVSGVLEAAADLPLGARWITPVQGGRRVVNATLAALRRPALRLELPEIYRWLAEAEEVAAPPTGRLDAALLAAEAADRAGDLEAGSARLRQAWEQAGRPDDLGAALAARAEALVRPALHPHADPALSALSRRPIPAIAAARPDLPAQGWTALLRRAEADGPGDETLGLIEAVGAPGRAARAWLAGGEPTSLLQAARLAEHLDDTARGRLAQDLARLAPEDELVLAADEGGRRAAVACWWVSPPSAARDLGRARLLAAFGPAPAEVEAAPEGEDEDDPHSFPNRLAAAADLVVAGRMDAAATVLAALLRRVPAGPDAPRAARLTSRVLEREDAPAELVDTVDKHLRQWDHVAEALLEALIAAPAAAYPCYEGLLEIGLDVSRADRHRWLALTAWLGIWRATRTAPNPELLAPMPAADEALLPLAAARLAAAPDPVGAALAFMARYPVGVTDPDAYSDALLAASLG